MPAFLSEALSIKSEIIAHREYVHQNAELGLSLPKTSSYVAEKLRSWGIEPQFMAGGCGIKAVIKGKQPGKTFLLRADMDALPIEEHNDLPFRCQTGAMHACGHDCHTAMLLGAAKLLKAHEDELCGCVTLMFQPGEEINVGAGMMVKEGLLQNPDVDAALMIHMQIGHLTPKTGTIIVSPPDGVQKSNDWFKVTVKGKGCHGAYPDAGIDPLNVLARIFTALQEINAREVSPMSVMSLTIGEIHGGTIANAVPESGYLAGTIRTMDQKVCDFVKQRVEEICVSIGKAFRTDVEVAFGPSCPVLNCDHQLQDELTKYTVDMLGSEYVEDNSRNYNIPRGMGSEDFSWVSQQVPSMMFMLSGGNTEEGYPESVHSPNAKFNEDALPHGAAVYANSAFLWLENHK